MNNVILTGRMTKNVELKYTPKGTAVAKINIAVDRGKDKGGQERTDFPRITVFGKQAENLATYCGKGSLIGIEGRVQTDSYQDKNGTTVYTTDIIADRVEFLSTKRPEQEAPDSFEMINEQIPF